MAVSDDTIEMPALGRPLQLGMLYDCRNDSFIPGVTLWDLETLQNNVDSKPKPNTEFDIIASDTIEKKASALEVTASLKASFLGGLVKVDGSAKYLNDTKSSQHQARVILQYSTTTRFEQLIMSHLGRQNVSYPDVFDSGTATHVVSAVLYGAQAFFVFDREVSSSENIRKIEGDLNVNIKKFILIEGEGALKMDENERAQTEKCTCKFYGDFDIENNPATYQEAMKIYSALPKLLGDKGEKAVPVRVWLYPLTKIDSKAAQLMREIRTDLIVDVQTALEQMIELDMRCNDMLKSLIATTFPEIKRKTEQFQNLCKQYRQTFQKELAKALPSIRVGKAKDDSLQTILTTKEESPFSNQRLTEFLDKKEEEMKLVESCLSTFNKVEAIAFKRKLNEILQDSTIQFVVSFTFTSLQEEEEYISELKHWFQIQTGKKTRESERTRHVPKKPKSIPQDTRTQRSRKILESATSFSTFANINKSNVKTQFIVASALNSNIPGASIYLYDKGELRSTAFEPPSKPLPPVIGGISHDHVQLTFKSATCGRRFISGYQVKYRIVGHEKWMVVNGIKQETFTVTGLCPNTEYQFRYAAVSKPGLSESSDVSETVKTLPTSPPGKPEAARVAPCAIALTWEPPTLIGDGVVIKEYKVEYKEKADGAKHKEKDKWLEQRTGIITESCNIDGLIPNKAYTFRVSALCADGMVSDPSKETLISTPKKKESKKQVHNSPKLTTLIRNQQPPMSPATSQTSAQWDFVKRGSLIAAEQPSVYALPLEEAPLGSKASSKKNRLGKENLQIPNKVIMVMGATGSGKTTLINGMVNYILGVQWEDEFRFKLIHEITNRSQAESQTSEVTAYEVNYKEGFQIPYSLTIIDTPGFGDTRGIEHDKEITRQIQEFFSTPGAIDHIDAICFVVQASLARLTHAQKYVFDSVLSIFGKDIKDNIQILITFADGQTPPVLEAIKESEVPCSKDDLGVPIHFKFNNSALFAYNAGAAVGGFNFDEMFWKMGVMSMKTFFDSLSSLETKSLTLTKEVLKERKELEAAVQGLQPQIKVGLTKLEELRRTQRALEQHMDDMEANKDFEYEVEKTVPIQLEVIEYFITNCQQCHFTCHYPCAIADDNKKYRCWAMNSSGECNVCPGKCQWSVHFNQKYRWDYIVKKEKQTYAQLKEKYEKASGEVMTTEKIFEQLFEEYAEVEDIVLELIERSSQSLQRLQEIALKPNPLSTPEHIDLLIMSEEQEAKPGYQERIKSLNEVRETAVIITKIANHEELLPTELEIQNKRKNKEKPSTFRKMLNYFKKFIE